MVKILILFIIFTNSVNAAVTIHSFGHGNEVEQEIEKCDIAKNADSYFSEGSQFYTLYNRDKFGKCIRLRKLEKKCKPILYYCASDYYKYKSKPILYFDRTCPSNIFALKTFSSLADKEEACN